jgi:Na+/H+-dicarboxylate symporter/ABC-type amino acid transport substrate-binding protein
VTTTPWKRWSLSSQILFGVIVGAAVGLFFGEGVSFLQVVADAYVRLLQMTVLPYVTVAIIIGLGSLDAAQARALGAKVGVILVLIWTVAIGMVVLFPLMFPQNQNASFFSASLVEDREAFDFLGLYIPTNPFNSLANNVVPSVVLFSVVVGAALIANPHKRRLLDVLEVAAAAISKATNFIVTLTPYGVFAIAAVVAGTLRIEELARLQVYLITYVTMSILISLWVLPGLVATLTPVPYRALMSRTRDALVLAFMTTSLFAVLPLITEETKKLLREYANVGGEQDAAVDVIVPATFNFPHTGKLLSLSFILFAGWFADRSVPPSEYLRLAATGLLVLFGNVNAAIPYLLDLFRIPADTFRLFVTSGIVNARFGTLVAAVHTLAIAVLGTCAMTGTLRVDARKLMRFAIITGILLVLVVGGSRFVLQVALHRPYDKDTILTGMRMTRDRGAARVYRSGEAVPPMPTVVSSVLDRVRQRGVLRVGYFDDSLPFVFFNSSGELVGLDVEMALQLARDLGVRAELVPIERSQLASGLDPGSCDLVMSGAAVMADRATTVEYSAPYLYETVAFIVPDHLATAFSEWSTVKAMGRLRIGVPRAPYFMQKIRDELADVDIVPIDRMDDFFTPHNPPLDAGVLTAERGSAYTLLHPEYSVAVPKPRPLKVPLAYVIAGRDAAMVAMVNTWIELKRADGTIDELFSYWILGQSNTARTPRWSIIHDVLGWR